MFLRPYLRLSLWTISRRVASICILQTATAEYRISEQQRKLTGRVFFVLFNITRFPLQQTLRVHSAQAPVRANTQLRVHSAQAPVRTNTHEELNDGGHVLPWPNCIYCNIEGKSSPSLMPTMCCLEVWLRSVSVCIGVRLLDILWLKIALKTSLTSLTWKRPLPSFPLLLKVCTTCGVSFPYRRKGCCKW